MGGMARRDTWKVPLSATFAVGVVATAVAIGAGPGCQTRCFNAFDCGDGSFCLAGRCETECFTNEDCLNPPECAANPSACVCKGLLCNAAGRCVGRCANRPQRRYVHGPRSDIPTEIEGWNRKPGDGQPFIIDSLAIADEGRGFDIDGRCRGVGDCIDNSLWQLGQLGNDQIRQGLRSGETLLLVELAGLDDDYRGNDKSLTVKWYGARDADEPFFPTNNFEIPAGEQDCCKFKINPQAVAGIPPQARARTPAKIERGQLKALAPVPIQFTLTVGVPPHPEIRIERTLMSARLAGDLSSLRDGLIGGAIPINTLAQTDNPYCKTLNSLCPRALPESTLIDLIASILQPDIDLDNPPDGLEILRGGPTGRIAECFDGSFGSTTGARVPPLDPTAEHTCALQPQMGDGYSLGLTFSAVGATIVGVGQ